MGEEMEVGCARPTGGPVGEPVEHNEPEKQHLAWEEWKTRMAFE